jgi:hypothetical protein
MAHPFRSGKVVNVMPIHSLSATAFKLPGSSVKFERPPLPLRLDREATA